MARVKNYHLCDVYVNEIRWWKNPPKWVESVPHVKQRSDIKQGVMSGSSQTKEPVKCL